MEDGFVAFVTLNSPDPRKNLRLAWAMPDLFLQKLNENKESNGRGVVSGWGEVSDSRPAMPRANYLGKALRGTFLSEEKNSSLPSTDHSGAADSSDSDRVFCFTPQRKFKTNFEQDNYGRNRTQSAAQILVENFRSEKKSATSSSYPQRVTKSGLESLLEVSGAEAFAFEREDTAQIESDSAYACNEAQSSRRIISGRHCNLDLNKRKRDSSHKNRAVRWETSSLVDLKNDNQLRTSCQHFRCKEILTRLEALGNKLVGGGRILVKENVQKLVNLSNKLINYDHICIKLLCLNDMLEGWGIRLPLSWVRPLKENMLGASVERNYLGAPVVTWIYRDWDQLGILSLKRVNPLKPLPEGAFEVILEFIFSPRRIEQRENELAFNAKKWAEFHEFQSTKISLGIEFKKNFALKLTAPRVLHSNLFHIALCSSGDYVSIRECYLSGSDENGDFQSKLVGKIPLTSNVEVAELALNWNSRYLAILYVTGKVVVCLVPKSIGVEFNADLHTFSICEGFPNILKSFLAISICWTSSNCLALLGTDRLFWARGPFFQIFEYVRLPFAGLCSEAVGFVFAPKLGGFVVWTRAELLFVSSEWGGDISGGGLSGGGLSGGGLSGEGLSRWGVSRGGNPGGGLQGGVFQGGGVSGGGVSWGGVSGEGVSGEGVSGESVSGESVSGEGVSGGKSHLGGWSLFRRLCLGILPLRAVDVSGRTVMRKFIFSTSPGWIASAAVDPFNGGWLAIVNEDSGETQKLGRRVLVYQIGVRTVESALVLGRMRRDGEHKQFSEELPEGGDWHEELSLLQGWRGASMSYNVTMVCPAIGCLWLGGAMSIEQITFADLNEAYAPSVLGVVWRDGSSYWLSLTALIKPSKVSSAAPLRAPASELVFAGQGVALRPAAYVVAD